MQQGSGGLVELLLGADDFYDLLSTIQYLDVIQARNASAVDELVAMENELTQTRIALDGQQQEAEDEQRRAEDALAEAEQARGELEEKIAAQAAAEEAQRRAALEAAQRAREEAERAAAERAAAEQAAAEALDEVEEPTFTTESGTEAPVEVPESPDAAASTGPPTSSPSSPSGAPASTPISPAPPLRARGPRSPRRPGCLAWTRASPRHLHRGELHGTVERCVHNAWGLGQLELGQLGGGHLGPR